MHFHIITLFPKAFDSYLKESIIGRAIKGQKIKISFYNPRGFTINKWHRVDRPPYGGGPGLVLEAIPVIKAIEKALGRKKNIKIIFLSPRGKQFNNKQAELVSTKYKHLVIVCGRYEGIDARVKKIFSKTNNIDEISVGPYVLTGGELPAMVIMDSVSRHLKGVLGNSDSLEERRIASSEVYTRPEVLSYRGKKYRVPKVLLSGHHGEIEKWKKKQ